MVAVGMSWAETQKYLAANVTIACGNPAKSVTIAGDVDEREHVLATIHKLQPDVVAKKLQVDKAYRSHHMVEIGEDYHSLIEPGLKDKQPTSLIFSSINGKLLNSSDRLDSRYWQKNLESPVLFNGAVSASLWHPIGKHAVFLEVGPHSALAGPLRQIFTKENSAASYVSAMVRNRSCFESFLSAAGKLWTLQAPIDLKALIPAGSCLPDSPRYPWDHEESYWLEARLSKEYRQRKHARHSLLGSECSRPPIMSHLVGTPSTSTSLRGCEITKLETTSSFPLLGSRLLLAKQFDRSLASTVPFAFGMLS